MRPESVRRLMDSVVAQKKVPDEILIIDGSIDDETSVRFRESEIPNLRYYKVPSEHRGLTKQRNYGINLVSDGIDIVAFLDDDVILLPDYFHRLLKTYDSFPAALGVGGYIVNDTKWEPFLTPAPDDLDHFYNDGYRRKESSRYKLRRRLGLAQEEPPGFYPEFGHGRSVGFLPPSGKTYPTETLMGGVSSFPLKVLKNHKFSEYFEGYGLYEDADFTLRLSKIGSLYINTGAQLEHHHDFSGRPNSYTYGKMVVRNGWYVWRVKYENPSRSARFKWYQITILQAVIRFSNVITTQKRGEAFYEATGRIIGLFSLIYNKPCIE